MHLFILLALAFHLSCGLVQPQLRTFDLRQNCTNHHSNNKYKAFCDGSRYFKTKNLFLNSRDVSKIAEIELYSFESINIVSKTSSDLEHIEKITIRNCTRITFNFQSQLRLNVLFIDSVSELTFETEQAEYSIETRSILLSNVGKLHLTYSSKAVIKTSNLTFKDVKDVSFYGKLQFSGELLTVSQSNIDLSEHTTLSLKFASITVKDSTKLYVEESGHLDVSTENFLIQECYMYMFGKINVSGHEFLGQRKIIKILNNSIYGLKKDHFHINGDVDEIDLIENGIYQSDISDIMIMVAETEGVTFTKNHFGCNKCTKEQSIIEAKYLRVIGEQNFCDSTCNLTLATYRVLLDQGNICSLRSEFEVDDKTLCSARSEPKLSGSYPAFFIWILIAVITVLVVFSFILSYFYCKRHSPRFQTMPVAKKIEERNNPENQKVTTRAFSNEVYGREKNIVALKSVRNSTGNKKVASRSFSNEVYEPVSGNPDNIYEPVDSPAGTQRR